MTTELCDCGKKAVWCYMPGYSNGNHPFSCDDCVFRGCECNHHYCNVDAYHPPLNKPDLPEGIEGVDWKWVDKGTVWTYIDDKQREYPCAEYMYDEEGFEREINPHEYETH